MQQSQEMQGEQKEELGEAVNASLGLEGNAENAEPEGGELPEAAKKRLGMQEKRHKKELRRMQQQLDELQNHLRTRPEPLHSPEQPMNPYSSQPEGDDMNDPIYRAVAKAMEMQKMQEHKAREAEKMQHVHKSYKALQDNLDNASSKYEDFDDIVKAEDAPYTDAMRDAALLIKNPEDVLYHLGKDKDKLHELSKKHPLDQAREVINLSIALMSGTNGKPNVSNAKPLGQVKNSPVTSTNVNDTTSVSELRKRLRDGGKKWS